MSIIINEIEVQNELLHKKLINIDMKTIGIIGFIIVNIGFVVGIYCQFQVIPSFNALDVQYNLNELDRALWRSLADQKFLLGSIALFLGALGSVVGFVTGLKKQKMGWAIFVMGLISFILGAIQSTHMFS
jgi:hypothetical protein